MIDIKRDLNLDTLRAAFSGRLHTEAADMAAFLTDWRGKWTGRAIAVAQPDSTRDVAAILGWCHQHRVPVVPQGGNTGYDLRGLFIGSEGTLGIITAAVLKLFPLPAAQVVALVAVPSAAAALAMLSLAQQRLAAGLTAFELISETCLQLVEKHGTAARRPLQETSPWYVLMEVSSAQGEAEAAAGLQAVQEAAMEAGHANDAALSASVAQFRSLWALRENISEAQGAEGPTIKHDISLPIAGIPAFIAATDAAIARHFPGVRLVVFGHLGDGNLHYNLSPPLQSMPKADFAALEGPLNRLVHDAVNEAGGSISAEHGLGVLRRDEAARYKSALEQHLMCAVKNALDPHHLMNPGKLLGPAAT